jgi:hypothetical protein
VSHKTSYGSQATQIENGEKKIQNYGVQIPFTFLDAQVASRLEKKYWEKRLM